MGILSFCKKHHIVMRNSPFQGPKSTISHLNIGFIGLRNGQYQKAKRIFSDYVTGYMKRRYMEKQAL